MRPKRRPDYKVVSLLDVDQLLSFAKNEVRNLDEEIKEEQRVEKELKEFIDEIEKHSGHDIHYIGHEKRFGKHLVRFLFQDGGFLEVIVEKPLVLNGHFISEETAKKFATGLKKALRSRLPEHPVKDLFIDSIRIEDGFKDAPISVDKWNKLHKLTIHGTLVTTFVVLIIFITIEVVKEYFKESSAAFLHPETAVVSIVTAVLISLFFEPLKGLVEKLVAKVIRFG